MQADVQTSFNSMFRTRHPVLLLLLIPPALAACGSQPDSVLDAARTQPPIPGTPGGHPAPLAAVEIGQYLQVMREAAQRVQHPSATERQMLARADAITAAANRGDVSLATEDGDVLAQALAFRMQMDLQVAKAHHLDPGRYQPLSERIEDEVGELYCHRNSPVPDPALKPHVAEVERLVGIVRNPGALGSPPVSPACADE